MKKIMDKIRKLLALSESSNEHEAAAAMRQARKLMDKHQLSSVDSEVFAAGCTTIASKSVRHPKWESDLASMVGDAFGCSSYLGYHRVRFVGPHGMTEVAGYTFNVLLRQLRRAKDAALDEYRWLTASEKRQLGRSFAEAWVHAVWSKVDEFAAPLTEHQRAAHSEYLKKAEGSIITPGKQKKSAISDDPVAMAGARMGYAQGGEVQLHYGVGAAEGPARLTALDGAA